MVAVHLLVAITKIQSTMPADRIRYVPHLTKRLDRKWHAKDAFVAVVHLMTVLAFVHRIMQLKVDTNLCSPALA